MRYYGHRRNDDNVTKGRRLRSKNRRTLRRFATGSARIKAARDLRNDVE
jgi:hypothetical protein